MTFYPLKLFFRDKIIFISLLASVLINLTLWIYLPLAIKPTAQTVFLHYTVHFGVDLIDAWRIIFNLPLIGLIIILVNLFLAYFIYDFKFLSRLLLSAAAVVQIFIFIQAVFLAYLNF